MSFPSVHEAEPSSSYSLQQCREFTLPEIVVSTDNFDESGLLGSGGFAKVYKGTITCEEGPLDVAIKRLKPGLSEGTSGFWYEVAMLSKLRHPHLVSQIGYCNDMQEMIFVYDYLPLGTLEDRLHKDRFPLSWMRRLKICLDAARGLEYLHSEMDTKSMVLHLDFKSSNILLASNWAAKISDFGLSKVRPTESAYLTDHVGGTLGYLDPHFQLTGEASRKTDVFAFGVIMFEVLCAIKAYTIIDGKRQFLRAWAQDSIKKGKLKQIIDRNLEGRISTKCLKKFVVLADRCLHIRPQQRPSMAKVVQDLESILALQEEVDNESDRVLYHEQNSVGGVTLKSLDRYLYTVRGEGWILRRVDFTTILQTTEIFSNANTVSYHGYGCWSYKGRLQNGQQIIITQYSDARAYKKCMDEASLVVKFEHENVIRLFGYCIYGTTVCLFYDFAFNATLADLIKDPMCTVLDLNKRYKIIVGVARGLTYLHHHAPIRIIHGNVALRNIVLNESFEPKLWSFGLAMAVNEFDCIYVDNISGILKSITNASTCDKGFVAPEYHQSLRLSTKVDVYAFGVLLLQIVIGGSTSDEFFQRLPDISFLRYFRRKWLEGALSDTIDYGIDSVDSALMTKLIQIGLLCCRDSYKDRPTMEEVVGMLLGTTTLPVLELEPRRSSLDLHRLSEEDYDATAVGDFILELCPR